MKLTDEELTNSLLSVVRDAAKKLPLMVSFTKVKGKLKVVTFSGKGQGCSDDEEDPVKALLIALSGLVADDF
jgi:hypothetical protein